ncbi:hypothetical protein M4I20_08140 [Enterococcus hirae]|uniref:hypothetical protein n=1 Tax=Enterococcus hirae TaxID=1354 RepID=UPI00254312D1|nr:hypothetical protein [Enterococcus hirae]MDK4468363.1 hypothetical protein [Enterococcus hirae]
MNTIINISNLPTDESKAEKFKDIIDTMKVEAYQAFKRIDKDENEKKKLELKNKINELAVIKAVEPLRTSEIDEQLIQLNKQMEGLMVDNIANEAAIKEYVLNNHLEELREAYIEAQEEHKKNHKAWLEFDEQLKKEFEEVKKQTVHFLHDPDFKLNERWLKDYLRFTSKDIYDIGSEKV